MIRAAGGIVVRDGRVLLVHRARYDDWSLPKGKLEPGETWEAAALREVLEETGVRGQLGEFLGASHYHREGRAEEVRWWRMTTDDEARRRTRSTPCVGEARGGRRASSRTSTSVSCSTRSADAGARAAPVAERVQLADDTPPSKPEAADHQHVADRNQDPSEPCRQAYVTRCLW